MRQRNLVSFFTLLLMLVFVNSARATSISDLSQYSIDWTVSPMSGGIDPKTTNFTYNTTTSLFTNFTIHWNGTAFNLLNGGVYQSVNLLPHGPAEFHNALFTGGTWEVQRDSLASYYFILQPSYGDGIDTAYASSPLIRPQTSIISSGTFSVGPATSVPEPASLLLLGMCLAMMTAWRWIKPADRHNI